MRKIGLDELEKLDTAPEDLYLKRGHKIFDKDQIFPTQSIEKMRTFGIDALYAVTGDELENFRFHASHQELSLNSDALKKEGQLSQSLYSREGELVLKSGGTWTKELANKLKGENQESVYLRRSEEKIKQDEENANHLKEVLGTLEVPNRDTQNPEEDALSQIVKEFDTLDENCFTTAGLDKLSAVSDSSLLPDTDNALKDQIKCHDYYEMRSEDLKEKALEFHKRGIADLRYLMEALVSQQEVEMRLLSDLARDTIQALVDDKDLLLHMSFIPAPQMEDFVFAHSINSAMIAINIATAMGYSAQQIYELSFGAFLHDVGMLRVPQEVLLKPGKLTELERSEIFKHPLWAIDLLQRLPRIPPSSPLVAYQSHERGDKSGYPRRKSLTTIHQYARIVAVADIYTAMIAPRPHRPAHSPYAAMEFMTREVVHGRLDRDVLKAFMSINSLYPVGSWVVLSDGGVGKVVAAHPDQYDRPVIRVFFKGTQKLDRKETLELSEPEHKELRVIKTFDASRLKIGFLEGF